MAINPATLQQSVENDLVDYVNRALKLNRRRLYNGKPIEVQLHSAREQKIATDLFSDYYVVSFTNILKCDHVCGDDCERLENDGGLCNCKRGTCDCDDDLVNYYIEISIRSTSKE
jgi:hypothetical protein